MIKKIFFVFLFLFLFYNLAFAETCPSLFNLKMNQLHEWQAMDFGSAEPATEQKITFFLKNATQFVVASWDFSMYGRCFYAGDSKDPDDLGVFLQKETSPDESSGNWKFMDPDSTICDAGIEECKFL